MAEILNYDALTLGPKEDVTTQNLMRLLSEMTYMQPELGSLHEFDTGITMKQQIVIPELLGKSGLKSASCDRVTSGAKSVLSEKFWEPELIEDTFYFCPKTEIPSLYKAHWDKIQKAREIYETLGDSDELRFIASLLEGAIRTAIWRAIWLGNKNVAAATSTVAGLGSADDIKFYNYFDGFLQQIITAVAANKIQYYKINENSGSSIEEQENLADGRAEEIFRIVKRKADTRLKSNPNAKFYVTDGIFENYKDSLMKQAKNFTVEFDLNGMPTLKWDGNEIVNCETIFGMHLKNDFVNNSVEKLPMMQHVVIFSTPQNLRVGTLNNGDFEDLESFYDQPNRKHVMAYSMKLDAKVIQEHLVSAAF